MKKVLSVFLVLGLLLSIGFAAENSFNTQIDNSINTVKQAFIAKKIDQADLLAKLTIMSAIEKVAVEKIKIKSISDEDYLLALDKCNEISNNVISKVINDLKNNNKESLNAFSGFINGYKQKAGNILTCQQNCINNIKEFSGVTNLIDNSSSVSYEDLNFFDNITIIIGHGGHNNNYNSNNNNGNNSNNNNNNTNSNNGNHDSNNGSNGNHGNNNPSHSQNGNYTGSPGSNNGNSNEVQIGNNGNQNDDHGSHSNSGNNNGNHSNSNGGTSAPNSQAPNSPGSPHHTPVYRGAF